MLKLNKKFIFDWHVTNQNWMEMQRYNLCVIQTITISEKNRVLPTQAFFQIRIEMANKRNDTLSPFRSVFRSLGTKICSVGDNIGCYRISETITKYNAWGLCWLKLSSLLFQIFKRHLEILNIRNRKSRKTSINTSQ